MGESLSQFIGRMSANPALFVTATLILGAILVNGWTDAPNAIATCVTTRCMGVRAAILMSALFNFLGVLVMSLLNPAVAMTVTGLARFGGESRAALAALCAALVAIVLWAAAAWRFGIPTSESHALIAGISGAAVALHGGLGGLGGEEWAKVLYGLALSLLLGCGSGFCVCRLTGRLARNVCRPRANRFFRGAQIFGGAAMSFMHGAQDGQKFLGVLLLGAALAGRGAQAAVARPPLWMMLLCSLVMAAGTSIGGKRIIKSVGMDMARLEPYQGFSADIASAGCLLLCSLLGIPVSTTHTKTAAVMGVGAAKRLSALNYRVAGEMAVTWLLTFPGCGLIGYLAARLLIRLL